MSGTPPAPIPASPPTPVSTWAIASLVLGILSISCLWILGALPAIILGVIALRKTGSFSEKSAGRNLAIAGITTGGIGTLAGLIPVAIALSIVIPAVSTTRHQAEKAHQSMEIRRILLACHLYAHRHEGRFPGKLETLHPRYIQDDRILFSDEENTIYYRYIPGVPANAGPEVIVVVGPEIRPYVRIIGYADGSVSPFEGPLPPGIESALR